MKKREHPAIQRTLSIGFFIVWPCALVCFSLALYLLKHGYETAGWTFAVLFGVSIVCGIAFAFWRLHRVRCPKCGGRVPTVKDETRTRWLAKCERCKIAWDLNTEVD